MKRIIVSRHPGAVAWLREQLLATIASPWADAPVLATATVGDVAGAIVAGNVPLSLAAAAHAVIAIEFSGTPPRGAEYSIEDMRAAGAFLNTYAVTNVSAWQQNGAYVEVADALALEATATARRVAI